jgi:streptomycin 6-kinase
VDRAGALFAELAASQGERRLLHGDLHHGNVLWDDRRGWLAIDPKGVVGEPAYEFGAALRNPDAAPTLVASPAVARRRSHIIADRLGLDRRRVLAWGFAQAVLAAVWAREGGDAPDWALAAALALRDAA